MKLLASPFSASLNSNKLYRTGFEYETFPLSTRVTFEKPQASSCRATWQPNDPDPKRRHFVSSAKLKSRLGAARHFMRFKFKVTAWAASSSGSKNCFRSTAFTPPDRGSFTPFTATRKNRDLSPSSTTSSGFL